MLQSKPFAQPVVARLGEFFAEKSAWFRGLWDVGTVLSLRELVEVAGVTPAVISQEALDWFTNDVGEMVGKDEGLPRRCLLEIHNLLKNRCGPLHGQLEACGSNKDRALVLLEALQGNTALTWEDPEQQAAVDRLRVIFTNPEAGLRDVMAYANRVFRRLYRQRNLVLHGGKTQSTVLGPTLRTAAPILGAGLDRIAHAWLVQKIEPLELAATARMRIDIARDVAAPNLVELLE